VNRQEQILVHKIVKQREGNSLEAIKLRQDRPAALSQVILDASYFKNKQALSLGVLLLVG
jgi:hypothetical protein